MGGRGFGGGKGPTGFNGLNGTAHVPDHSIRTINPGGKIGRGGNPLADGGNRTGGGGGDHPRKPRWPKLPIIGGVGTTVTTVTPSTPGVAKSQLDPSGDGRSSTARPARGGTAKGVPPADEGSYVPDEVLIQVASSVSTEAVDALARRLQLNRVESFDSNGVTMFRW